MDTFFGPYFHFWFELALETWAKASLTQSLRVHDPNHTHSLASFRWSGLFDQWALHLTECCLQVQKWCPYKWRGVVPELVCANKVRNGPASANQGFSTASQGSCHVHSTPCWNPPTSPYPAFFASAKPIVTENVLRQLINAAKVRRCHMASSVLRVLSDCWWFIFHQLCCQYLRHDDLIKPETISCFWRYQHLMFW